MAKIEIDRDVLETLMNSIDLDKLGQSDYAKGADALAKAIDVLINASAAPPVQAPEKLGKYCYAWNEEGVFWGDYETEAEAIAVAIREADQDIMFDVMFVGETQYPREWLDENRIGEDIADMVRERLEDEAGEAAENFETTFEQHTEIGKHVLDYIERAIGFKCYGVKNIRKVQVPAQAVANE
jgi:hypothetical protein